MKISTKIILFSTTTIIFLFLFYVEVFYQLAFKTIQNLSLEKNYLLTQQIGWHIDSFFENTIQTMKTTFKSFPLDFSSFYIAEPFDSFIILNSDGEVVNSIPFKEELTSLDYSQEIFFKDILGGKSFYIFWEKKTPESNKFPLLNLTFPLTNEKGEIKNIVLARLKINHLFKPHPLFSLGKNSKLFIISEDGEVIFYLDESLKKEEFPLKINPALLQKINNNEKIIFFPRKNPTFLFTVESLKTTNWKVVVEQPLSEVYSSFQKSKNYFVGFAIVIVFVSSFSLFILTKEGLKNLQKLFQEIEIIKNGNFRHRIRIESKDEVGEVAEAINRTVSEIENIYQNLEKIVQERTLKLERSEEEKTISLIREKAISADAERKAKELEKTRKALMNILEDVEEERKKAEEEKTKTLAVIQSFVDGIIVLDKEKRVLLMNPQAEKFFQIKSKELIGKTISQLQFFPIFHPLIDLVGPELKEISKKELSLREGLILEVSTVPIFLNEEIFGHLIILHDITREKEIERIKTEFVSISAHQLRTPLSAIKWSLKMVLDGDLGPLSEEQKEVLKKTFTSNERLINLVNDLLNVARIEEGRYLFKLSKEDFISLVLSVVETYQEEIKNKRIDFLFERPEKKIFLVLDAEKISLAVQNLIENAIKYTPAGGKIIVSIFETEKEIVFSVADSGLGIPQNQQYRVFSKFFRGANVTKLETEGSGLGLFITKNIIEAHNGKIWFISEEGKGSTFYFTLPKIE